MYIIYKMRNIFLSFYLKNFPAGGYGLGGSGLGFGGGLGSPGLGPKSKYI